MFTWKMTIESSVLCYPALHWASERASGVPVSSPGGGTNFTDSELHVEKCLGRLKVG